MPNYRQKARKLAICSAAPLACIVGSAALVRDSYESLKHEARAANDLEREAVRSYLDSVPGIREALDAEIRTADSELQSMRSRLGADCIQAILDLSYEPESLDEALRPNACEYSEAQLADAQPFFTSASFRLAELSHNQQYLDDETDKGRSNLTALQEIADNVASDTSEEPAKMIKRIGEKFVVTSVFPPAHQADVYVAIREKILLHGTLMGLGSIGLLAAHTDTKETQCCWCYAQRPRGISARYL